MQSEQPYIYAIVEFVDRFLNEPRRHVDLVKDNKGLVYMIISTSAL